MEIVKDQTILAKQVRLVDAAKINLPILRSLVTEVQAKTQDEIYENNRQWTDSNWSQWKQHSSHNPW
jgi:hypothetical protein